MGVELEQCVQCGETCRRMYMYWGHNSWGLRLGSKQNDHGWVCKKCWDHRGKVAITLNSK